MSEPRSLQVLGDAPLYVGQLVQDLLLLHPGEALQLQFDDGLGLFLAELESGNQVLAGFARHFGGADDADDFVEVVQRLLEAEQEVLALACLAQFELGAPADHFDAVIDEVLDAIDQAQLARLPVDDGQHDDAEADLKLGVLVEVVEHHLGLFAALELEDDAHAVAVALVAYVADAVDLLFVDQRGSGLDEARLVHLVGNLGDDDLLAVLGQFLDGSARAQLQLAASGHVGLQDALPPEDESAGGEVGALHKLHDFREAGRGVLDQMDGGVDDFGEVVGREIRRHADGDAARSVDQQIRHACRQNFGFLLAVVVVGFEIDGFLVDIFQQRGRNPREAGFGIPHGGGGIAVDGAEVPLAVHQRVAHGEGLGHADQRIVDRRIAVRVVLAHHLAGDFGRLGGGTVGREAHFGHPEQDAPVYRFEPVADIREARGR